MKKKALHIISKDDLYRLRGGGNVNAANPETPPGKPVEPPDKPIRIDYHKF